MTSRLITKLQAGYDEWNMTNIFGPLGLAVWAPVNYMKTEETAVSDISF